MKSKVDLIMNVTTKEGEVIYTTPIAPHLRCHAYPGGAPTSRMMIGDSIMARLNTDVEKWSKGDDD